MSTETTPDTAIATITSDDVYVLGVFSNHAHVLWTIASDRGLGVGNDPRYNRTRCFETFPVPDPPEPLKARIRQVAEELDALRKARQAEHPGLTMTGMYNVLEKLRRGEPLGAKDKLIHEQGLVSVLRQLHDELDTAVLAAYGWEDLAPRLIGRPGGTSPLPDKPADQAEGEEELLARLVALNRARAAEEARGLVRWLRPDFQCPSGTVPGEPASEAELELVAAKPAAGPKAAWPKTLQEQFQALRAALAEQTVGGGPIAAEQLARSFVRAPRAKVAELLTTLAALGHARRLDDGRYLPG